MTRMWRRHFTVFVFAVFVLNASSISAAITLVGRGQISGEALDRSGLTGDICQAGVPTTCVPKAIFGGFGSDISYTGHNNVFISAPDRGPYDGLTDVPYLDRFHFLHITTNIGAAFPNINISLLDTRFFKNEFGQIFQGSAGAFDTLDPLGTLRFDPEGIRVGANGNFYISDEYGPYVFEFDRQGNIVRRLAVPQKFFIANPNSDPTGELLNNTSGRQANRGMEGLAISPDGSTLFGIMQNALLQDNALTPGTTTRISRNTRILKIDLATGSTQEFVYVMDATGSGHGVCEILAINDHELLVLERDNRIGNAAVRKTIYKIDLDGATDVSNIEGLPAAPFAGAVTKLPFIDLLDAAFGLKPTMPEKIEGLAWGPDLADGRHVLYVTSDNDLNPAIATQIYAFAIGSADIDLQPQYLPGPLFPPGQVKKALRDQ